MASVPFPTHGDCFQIITHQIPANLIATVVCIVAALKIKLGTVQFFYTCAAENIVNSLKQARLITFDSYRKSPPRYINELMLVLFNISTF
ncbi:MAG: hypothetical protein WGN25_01235 [Candidatus Electrothrix sp. GW3-4]|uniref:hypothetical protein n=1 Tax=Candidatus Electrothrix sp. GW3-4 TaxID=3126740 RepID=UPI0030CDAD0C